jgi:hypothetical protein
MKALLATLLLLLQLQPALGTVVCLGLLRQPAQPACSMPEHDTALAHSVSRQAPPSSQSCAMAAVCAPAQLAVPGFAGQLESAVSLQTTPRIAGSSLPVGVASAPPFHPPRV